MTVQLKEKVILTTPVSGENPVAYAVRLSEWYCSQATDTQRKKYGIFFTPEPVAHHMGRLCRNGGAHFVRIIDPAAGTGILAAAACAALASHATAPRHIELVCYEIE